MRKCRKMISVIMLMVMLVSLLPSGALAAEPPTGEMTETTAVEEPQGDMDVEAVEEPGNEDSQDRILLMLPAARRPSRKILQKGRLILTFHRNLEKFQRTSRRKQAVLPPQAKWLQKWSLPIMPGQARLS